MSKIERDSFDLAYYFYYGLNFICEKLGISCTYTKIFSFFTKSKFVQKNTKKSGGLSMDCAIFNFFVNFFIFWYK
jgi:hypothetical protein